MKQKPYVPSAEPITGPDGRVSLGWIIFFNGLLEYVSTLTQLGERADQPDAGEVYEGTLYFVTDELVTERSNGTAWEPYSA